MGRVNTTAILDTPLVAVPSPEPIQELRVAIAEKRRQLAEVERELNELRTQTRTMKGE